MLLTTRACRTLQSRRPIDGGWRQCLTRQGSSSLADLHAEHQAAEPAQHIAGRSAVLVRHRTCLSSKEPEPARQQQTRQQGRSSAPRGQGVLHPLGARPGIARSAGWWKVGGCIEPEIGDAERGGCTGSLLGSEAGIPALVSRLASNVVSERPVHTLCGVAPMSRCIWAIIARSAAGSWGRPAASAI